jgi:hypothetical protein
LEIYEVPRKEIKRKHQKEGLEEIESAYCHPERVPPHATLTVGTVVPLDRWMRKESGCFVPDRYLNKCMVERGRIGETPSHGSQHDLDNEIEEDHADCKDVV